MTNREQNIDWVIKALSNISDDEIIRWARFIVAIVGPSVHVLTGCDQRSITTRAAAIQLFAGYRDAAQEMAKDMAAINLALKENS